VTAGAGSGAAGAGSRVTGADEAVRRGAGSARRGGRGFGRGTLTVTSGRVSEIWPQAASTPVKMPDDASAPSAAARNKRRFAAASRDASRPCPPAPRMTPTGEFPQILEHPPAPGLMRFCQFPSGTFGNVAAGTHATGAPPPRRQAADPGASPARRSQNSRRPSSFGVGTRPRIPPMGRVLCDLHRIGGTST
jgi:hypothetical protein